MKVSPVITDEHDGLSWGDIFTIDADTAVKNYDLVDGKVFIAVPIDYKTNSYWINKILEYNNLPTKET